MKAFFLLLATFVCLNVTGQRVIKEYEDIFKTKLLKEYQVDEIGVKNGYYKSYWGNGVLTETGFYKKGVRTGIWKGYDYDGSPYFISNYVNDKEDGVQKAGKQVQGGKFRVESIYKMGIMEQEIHYFYDGKVQKKLFRNGVCQEYRLDGTLSEEWTSMDGNRVDGSTIYFFKNGRPSIEIKDGKTYIYNKEGEGKEGALNSMEYDSAEFHFLYKYNFDNNGRLMRMFKDNNKTKETEGRYYINSQSNIRSLGPKFDIAVRDLTEAGNEVRKKFNKRLYLNFTTKNLSSMYIVTRLPYQKYTHEILEGECIEEYGYQDVKLRVKTLKNEKGLYFVTWYNRNGKLQCEYFVEKVEPEHNLVGLGIENREDGTKLKEIFVPKGSIGYYKELNPDGTSSIEYGLDSRDWDESDSKNCINYKKFYPSGKVSIEYGLFPTGFKDNEYYESGKLKSELFKDEGFIYDSQKLLRSAGADNNIDSDENLMRVLYNESGNVTNMKEIGNEIITLCTKAFDKKYTTIISGGDPSGRLPVLKSPDNVYYSISYPIGEDVYSMFMNVLDNIKLQFENASTTDDQKNLAVIYRKAVAKLISLSESDARNIYEQFKKLGKKERKNVENIKRIIGI
jgi:antitoxin component YwqK of YwqJK toxin-antitoxin module